MRERTVQSGVTYQDNYLAYDALGRLRDVADSRTHISIDYDLAGNRKRISTYVVNSANGMSETVHDNTRFFQYDAMNRQTVVDGVDAAGNIGTQGHAVTYDLNGNRTSDTSYGNRVTATDQPRIVGYDESGVAIYQGTTTNYTKSQGLTTSVYRYDQLNRLTSVETDGVQLDARLYDAAGRVVKSGTSTGLPVAYVAKLYEGVPVGQRVGDEIQINAYNAQGRLALQKVFNADGTARQDTTYSGYDAAGNVTSYQVVNREGDQYTNTYNVTTRRFDSYQQSTIQAVSTKLRSGTTTQGFDVNGHLTSVTDSTMAANNKAFVNDVNGQALYVSQNGNVQRQLIVNGEVLGRFGVGVDQVNPRDNRSNPQFAEMAQFEFGYKPITTSYPNAAPGSYTARSGDTLKSIAQSAYGDSSLWYTIAQANGLSSDSDLRAGQTLNVPNRVTGASNSASTYQPYDPSKMEGDKTPNLPVPQQSSGGGCGGLGKLLMVVVAVAVTIYTAGALSGVAAEMGGNFAAGASVMSGTGAGAVGAAGGALGSVGTMAVAAGAGSIASQAVGMAAGVQDGFSWTGVALSALGGGISGGLGGVNFTGGNLNTLGNVVVRAAVGSALSQGVAVVTGLQKSFSWKAVAASGVGAGVGAAVGAGMGNADSLATRAVSGFAGGLTTAAMRGGRISATQVAVDAFGNALGSGIAQAMYGTSGAPVAASGFLDDNAMAGLQDGLGLTSSAPTRGVQVAGGMREENIARMLRLANDADPGSMESLRQPDGTYRVEVSGVDHPSDGMTNSGDRWYPRSGYGAGDPYASSTGEPSLPTVVIRAPRMTQAEMDEFDRLNPGVADAARAAQYGSITATKQSLWDSTFLSPDVQHTMNNTMTGMVVGNVIRSIGSAVAGIRSDGYNFATGQHLNPVQRRDARIDAVINGASMLIGVGGIGATAASENAWASAVRRAELNAKFGRSGNLDVDINLRGAADIQRQVDRLASEGHAPGRHGPRLTELALDNRSMHKFDPITGTTTDYFTRNRHGASRNATKFLNNEGMLQAESYVRNSPEFSNARASAIANGERAFDVTSLKLEDIYGANYRSQVFGKVRMGPLHSPTVPVDFTDGNLVAAFRRSVDGNWNLHTMYPNPK